MTNPADKAIKSAKQDALYNAVADAIPAEIRRADMLAQIRRIHYEASIRKGFTADEALVLCVDTGIQGL